jgi:hypothetical protein
MWDSSGRREHAALVRFQSRSACAVRLCTRAQPCLRFFVVTGARHNAAQGIDDLIEQTGLSCKKVFEVDGSQQSSHSNAYVAGLCGTKRIVIYDTLIKVLSAANTLISVSYRAVWVESAAWAQPWVV